MADYRDLHIRYSLDKHPDLRDKWRALVGKLHAAETTAPEWLEQAIDAALVVLQSPASSPTTTEVS